MYIFWNSRFPYVYLLSWLYKFPTTTIIPLMCSFKKNLRELPFNSEEGD